MVDQLENTTNRLEKPDLSRAYAAFFGPAVYVLLQNPYEAASPASGGLFQRALSAARRRVRDITMPCCVFAPPRPPTEQLDSQPRLFAWRGYPAVAAGPMAHASSRSCPLVPWSSGRPSGGVGVGRRFYELGVMGTMFCRRYFDRPPTEYCTEYCTEYGVLVHLIPKGFQAGADQSSKRTMFGNTWPRLGLAHQARLLDRMVPPKPWSSLEV